MKRKLTNNQNCKCFYCGKHMSPKDRTFDHLVPQYFYKKIGANVKTKNNVVITHHRCNARKGHGVIDIQYIVKAIKIHKFHAQDLLKNYFYYKHKIKPLMDQGLL